MSSDKFILTSKDGDRPQGQPWLSYHDRHRELLSGWIVGNPEVMKPAGCLHVFGSDSVLYSHSKRLFTAARYGALPATTPMLATVSPFFIEGTAQTYRTTPLDGARASHTVLPNRSVT